MVQWPACSQQPPPHWRHSLQLRARDPPQSTEQGSVCCWEVLRGCGYQAWCSSPPPAPPPGGTPRSCCARTPGRPRTRRQSCSDRRPPRTRSPARCCSTPPPPPRRPAPPRQTTSQTNGPKVRMSIFSDSIFSPQVVVLSPPPHCCWWCWWWWNTPPTSSFWCCSRHSWPPRPLAPAGCSSASSVPGHTHRCSCSTRSTHHPSLQPQPKPCSSLDIYLAGSNSRWSWM